MRMTVIFAFAYGTSFAAIAAVIVHTILYHGEHADFELKTNFTYLQSIL